MGKSETMKKQIKDILGMVWKYNRILGGIKLLNAVLLAVLVSNQHDSISEDHR